MTAETAERFRGCPVELGLTPWNASRINDKKQKQGMRQERRTPRHPYTRALLASALTVTPGAGIPDNLMDQAYPNPLEMPPGCKFHPRCARAMPTCAAVAPPAVGAGERYVRCHLYTEEQTRVA